MKTPFAACLVGLFLVSSFVRAGEEPAADASPDAKRVAEALATAGGKEAVSVLPSGKDAKKAAMVQPVEESKWEISVNGGVRQFDLSFDTKPTAAFHSSPLHESDKLTTGFGGIELRRVMWQAETTIVRFGLGYNFSSASWDSGEHEAGEAPGEVYELDRSVFSLNAHQISAMVEISWKVGRAWEAGVRVGPTLSIFDGDFTGSHETFVENASHTNGRFVTGHVVRDSGTDVAFGVMGEAFLRYSLPDSSFFVELRAGYSWTDSVSYGDSTISAELDASSWLAELALGWKL